MEQRIPLTLTSENSYNYRNRSSNSETSHKWVRYIVGCVTVTSIFGLIIFLIMLGIPISMLVIGIRYRNQYYCPIEPRISLFLIVAGSVSIGLIILIILLSLLTIFISYKNSKMTMIIFLILSFFIFIGEIFSIIWLIIGSIWTFHIRTRVEHRINYPFNMRLYCHKTLYQFTFIYLIIIYILIGLQCCFHCCSIMLRWKKQK
ncbi:unnamed protein product [Rotaria sp. Silwood1]|nr:unnamed protein product [Rotaria sp. Silwood1]CAF1656818.1 unnamed protein product [Rotaria sp. Silwood1]CAF3851489.1 unnamed protein product [Rotaria sp. Silwood1]CAF4980816.1 unnamed protein product [Rotaria sp. Silwood1]